MDGRIQQRLSPGQEDVVQRDIVAIDEDFTRHRPDGGLVINIEKVVEMQNPDIKPIRNQHFVRVLGKVRMAGFQNSLHEQGQLFLRTGAFDDVTFAQKRLFFGQLGQFLPAVGRSFDPGLPEIFDLAEQLEFRRLLRPSPIGCPSCHHKKVPPPQKAFGNTKTVILEGLLDPGTFRALADIGKVCRGALAI